MAHVGVQACGTGVVVTGGQMAVTLERLALAPGDQHHLRVGLEPDDAVQDLGTDGLQHLRPVDIGLFVKPRLELHNHRHLFAPAHSLAQQIHQLRIRPRAVDGLLDGQYLRVIDGCAQKLQHPIEALKRLVDQHVTPLELIEDGQIRVQPRRKGWSVGRKTQIRSVHQVDQLGQAHQIYWPLHPIQGLLGQIKLLQQKVRQMLGATC